MPKTLKESVDNVTACQYCGRVCGTRTLKYEHEKNCPKNPLRTKSD